LHNGEKMKKMYVVSSMLLALGVMLASGCEPTTPTTSEPAPPTTTTTEEESYKLSQVELDAPFARDADGQAIAGLVSAKAGAKDVVSSVVNGKNGMAVVVGEKGKRTKLFVVIGDKAVFGIDGSKNGRDKLEKAKVDASLIAPLANTYSIGEVKLVSADGKEYIKFQTLDLGTLGLRKNHFAEFVVSLDDGKLMPISSGSSLKDLKGVAGAEDLAAKLQDVSVDSKNMYPAAAPAATDAEAEKAKVLADLGTKKVDAAEVNAVFEKGGSLVGEFAGAKDTYIVLNPASVFDLSK
jgi:hypothetical protein